jgi:hypothetical protein
MIKVNPSLATYQKLYAGGSNCVLKDWTIGGPEPTTFVDKSGCGNNGTFTDITMAQLASGLWTYQFNGSTSYINVSDTLGLNITARPLTILSWVKPASDAASDAYVICRNLDAANNIQYSLSWDSTLYVNCGLEGEFAKAISTAGSVPKGSWSLMGFVWGADGVIQPYVNGAANGTPSAAFTSALTTRANINIGCRAAGEAFYKGDMALWRVLPVAWSAADWLKAYSMERVLFA